MSNQNPYIEEGQTTQWSKEKGQNDKQAYVYKTDSGIHSGLILISA
jgi:hypothetical protein